MESHNYEANLEAVLVKSSTGCPKKRKNYWNHQ